MSALLRVLDEELAEISAHIDALVEQFRESQRARGVPENKLITRAQIDAITESVLADRSRLDV